jgi:predicted O-methyltransferase YrrM
VRVRTRGTQGSVLFQGLRTRAGYASKAAGVLLGHPRQGIERALDVLADRRERRRRPYPYEAVSDWHHELHELFSLPWPCEAEADFGPLWSGLVTALSAHRLVPGRRTYGGWDDGGPALALASYCLARHLRPRHVVETGVAHGVTTRFVLDALHLNGAGELWSVDLPPLVATDLHDELAIAVPRDKRERWTLCIGSSRRCLPGLLERLGSIELFVHDSLHTERNLRFELEHAWSALAPGGAMLVDDVDFSPGLRRFLEQAPEALHLVARHDDRQRLFGVIRKEPEEAPNAQRPRAPARSEEMVFTQMATSSTTLRWRRYQRS